MTRAQLITAVATMPAPNYEIDVEVYTHIYGPPEPLNLGAMTKDPQRFKWVHGDGWQDDLPSYTGSMNVVLDIMNFKLANWWISGLRQNGLNPSWNSSITRATPTLIQVGAATSMSRALLVAFLKALP